MSGGHVGGHTTLGRGHTEALSVADWSEARTWRFLGLILVLQLGLTLLDPTPRYLMGDSASYLWSVFHDGPYDRSWTYPAWFLGPILSLHSLNWSRTSNARWASFPRGSLSDWCRAETGAVATSSLLSRPAFASSSRWR